MPFIPGASSTPMFVDTFSAGVPTQNEQQEASRAVVPRGYNPAVALGGTLAMAPLDLLDTVGSSSVLSWATGLERGDINRTALHAIDMPGLTNFADTMQPGIEATSGIAGIVASELITRKITAPGGLAMKGISKLPYVRRLATLEAEYANAMSTVRNVDSALARRGAMGLEQYVGEATVEGLRWSGRGDELFTQSTFAIKRNKAVLDAKGLAAAVGTKHVIGTEITMGLLLNQNGFLYDDSAAQNLTWMGLGVAGGAAFDWFNSAYQIRKFVNSDEVRRSFASALDPEMIEENRLFWNKLGVKEADDIFTFLGGSHTDLITNLLVGASKLEELPVGSTTDARSLLSNRERLATQQRKLARETMEKVVQKGVTTDGRTRLMMDTPGYGNHVDMTMMRDPASFYGVEMMGGIAESTSSRTVDAARTRRIRERIDLIEKRFDDPQLTVDEADALSKLRRRLEYEQTLTPQVLIDGEKMPLSEATSFEGFIEPDIQFIPEATPIFGKKNQRGIWAAHVKGSDTAPVSIDSDFAIHMPSGKSLDDADHYDMLRLYRVAGAAVDQLSRLTDTIVLPAKPNWFQLDMAEEILKRTDGTAQIQWPKGMTRDKAIVESIAQKAKSMRKWDTKLKALAVKRNIKNLDPESHLSRLRVRYNLPKLTAYERGVTGLQEHPVEALLRGVMAHGEEKIRQMTATELKQAVAEFKRLGDVAPVTARDIDSLSGNSFTFMMDESGQPIKPILMYSRPFKKAEWTMDTVAERLASRKMAALQTLTGPDAGELSALLTDSLTKSPDFDLASRTHELMDTQIQGGAVGAAPQTWLGSLGNSFKQSEWRDRDNPILLAATRLADTVSRITREQMRKVITNTFGDRLSLLENPRNAGSKLLLNQFHSYRSGWDLLDTPVEREGGKYWAMGLANTQKNRDRWLEAFGTPMKEGQTLMTPQGKEVVLDELALDIQQRFNMVSDTLVKEKNTILRANGLSQIDRVSWYTPPPNTNGKLIGFVIGPNRKPVPGMGIVADTPEEFERLKAGLQPKLQKLGMGYVFRAQEEIRDFASIWDKAQMDLIHPGTTPIQPNKTSRGVLGGSDISLKAFSDSLEYVRNQFMNHSRDVTETLLKEQINSAKARASIASEMSRNKGNLQTDTKYRSVYDLYVENLMSKSKLNASGSVVGRLFNPAEGAIDQALSAGAKGITTGKQVVTTSDVWEATNGWINRANPWSKSNLAKKDFDALSKKLGEHMPFESAAELIEKQGLGTRAWTAAELSGKLNQFSAAVLLRMMEVAHPIMNLSGIVNAMPAVVRQFAQREGETIEDFAKRVGHSASIFNLPNGKSVGVMDVGKLGSRALARTWKRSSHADFDYMVRRGYLSQEVAEFHRQFGAIESKGKWGSFFLGNTNSSNRFEQKGMVGWLSILSDKSEDFSRSWGHMVGLEIADDLGIKGTDARHAFAHDVANKMIANYSPHNRPEIFQGAIGSSLGLFMSFIQNYYQRMFRYVETKDYKSLVTQYVSQSALFGVTSIPGWEEFNKLMTDASEGEDDPTSSLHRLYGGSLGDLLSGGVISNIPRLFGAQAVDLYSRGDTSVRLPGTVDVPALSIVKKISTGIAEGIQAFSSGNPTLTGTQLAEITSNMMPNRPLAGLIEQFAAGGNDTDQYGQLVVDTRSAMEATYRLLGLRSMRQSRELEAFYANKNAMEHKAANDEVLRLATRAALRAGRTDSLPQIFEQYLENGGDPRNFRRWIQSNYEAATSTRGERQLEQALKDPNKIGQVMRLLDAGVGVEQDQQTPDPITIFGGSTPGNVIDQPATGLNAYPNQVTIPQPTPNSGGY